MLHVHFDHVHLIMTLNGNSLPSACHHLLLLSSSWLKANSRDRSEILKLSSLEWTLSAPQCPSDCWMELVVLLLLLCMGGECCEWDWKSDFCQQQTAALWLQPVWSHFSAGVSSLCVAVQQRAVVLMGWGSSGSLFLHLIWFNGDQCGARLAWRVQRRALK